MWRPALAAGLNTTCWLQGRVGTQLAAGHIWKGAGQHELGASTHWVWWLCAALWEHGRCRVSVFGASVVPPYSGAACCPTGWLTGRLLVAAATLPAANCHVCAPLHMHYCCCASCGFGIRQLASPVLCIWDCCCISWHTHGGHACPCTACLRPAPASGQCPFLSSQLVSI